MFASTRHTGNPESYYHGEGRVALTGSEPRFQYKLTDHLGNTMVLFEDKDGDKVITTESMSTDPALVEVLQRNFYYAFGLPMQGPWNHTPADPDMPYLYNGKELEGELGLGWYAYGFRYYDASVGRFVGVDPAANLRSWVSPYNYVQNNPINRIDPTGALDDPIHDSKTGEFLGHYNDSDFDGEIMLMDAETYQMITKGQDVVISPDLAEKHGTYLSDYVANDFDMGSKVDRALLSNVFTSLIDQAHSEGLIDYNSSQLEGGKFKIGNSWGAAHYYQGSGGDKITVNVHPVSLSQYQEGQFGGGTQSLFFLHHAGDAINILGVHEPLHRQYPGNSNHPIIDPLVRDNRAFYITSPAYQQHVANRIKKH